MSSIGILGTGMVGQAFARRLSGLGQDVLVGARSADSASLAPFAELDVRTGSFADAAAHADLLVNATNGINSLSVLQSIGADALAGKVVLDLSNELDLNRAGPPWLAAPDRSIGRRLQETFPETYVVKSLNTMNCDVMVDPSIVPGDHVVFLSGNDDAAKDRVRDFLTLLGWREPQMIDLGGIETAVMTEMMMPVWIGLMSARGGRDLHYNWIVSSP
jgi:predicted dinucleotide-binding enzyme